MFKAKIFQNRSCIGKTNTDVRIIPWFFFLKKHPLRQWCPTFPARWPGPEWREGVWVAMELHTQTKCLCPCTKLHLYLCTKLHLRDERVLEWRALVLARKAPFVQMEGAWAQMPSNHASGASHVHAFPSLTGPFRTGHGPVLETKIIPPCIFEKKSIFSAQAFQ